MNNRKQVNRGCDDTSERKEQIRQMVSLQVQEIVDGDRRGVPRTGTGGGIGEEEDRGRGGDTEDDTEGKYINITRIITIEWSSVRVQLCRDETGH